MRRWLQSRFPALTGPTESASARPTARVSRILTEHVGDELVIYDAESHDAHCLQSEAAAVWRCCDGGSTAADIATRLEMDLSIVISALDELERRGLLDQPVETRDGYSRREATVKFARVGAAVAGAGALIYTVGIGPPSAAASCIKSGVDPGNCPAGAGTHPDASCCSGFCSRNGGGNAPHCT